MLALLVVFAFSATAFAQDINPTTPDPDNATITITNAANGETYKIAKLFDATVTGTPGGSIAYTGTIPTELSAYFTADAAGNITATDALVLSDSDVQAALKAWAEANVTAQAVSDGSTLNFNGLPYGYYVITTTQGETLITVDSTNPNAEVIDKNTTELQPPTKSADDTDVFIGQTVTYTVEFKTANFYTPEKEEGATEDPAPEKIIEYTITDTPAAGSLDNITVTAIYVDDDGDLTTTEDQTTLTLQQFANGKITIPWVNEAGQSLYKNGTTLVITYTGVVADTAAIDGAGNKNTVEVSFKTDKGTEPEPGTYTDNETIYTYAIAIKKVDQKGQPLAGATFQLTFYVEETPAEDGAYVYAGTTAGEGLTNTVTTPADGLIIIKGVASGTYSITETVAPDGYNKLTEPVSVTAVKTGQTSTSTTTFLDADGNIVAQETTGGSTVLVSISELAATPVVVVNKTGSELPSTGGVGTTIFYILGVVLVAGCGVVLVSRKRMSNK